MLWWVGITQIFLNADYTDFVHVYHRRKWVGISRIQLSLFWKLNFDPEPRTSATPFLNKQRGTFHDSTASPLIEQNQTSCSVSVPSFSLIPLVPALIVLFLHLNFQSAFAVF